MGTGEVRSEEGRGGRVRLTILTAFIIAVFAMALVVGCGSDTAREAVESGSDRTGGASDGARSTATEPAIRPQRVSDTRVVVTSRDDSLPDGCRPRQAALLVSEFFDAFNRGDAERLSRLFFVSEGPSPTDFSDSGAYPWSWYSVSRVGEGGRILGGFTTYDQGELLRYFGRRHERGERLRLLKVGLTGPGLLGEEDNVGIIYVLTREADDLPSGLGGPDGVAFGKGAINCGRRQIFVWGMEMRAGEDRNARDAARWLCGNPLGWRPGEAVVACA